MIIRFFVKVTIHSKIILWKIHGGNGKMVEHYKIMRYKAPVDWCFLLIFASY